VTIAFDPVLERKAESDVRHACRASDRIEHATEVPIQHEQELAIENHDSVMNLR
jgi:hypothetical protein